MLKNSSGLLILWIQTSSGGEFHIPQNYTYAAICNEFRTEERCFVASF
jgi:hypothetical protein